MEIKVTVWNGIVTRAIAKETFNSVEELKDFMAIVHKLDSNASYIVEEIKK